MTDDIRHALANLKHATGVLELYTCGNIIARLYDGDGNEAWYSDALDDPKEALLCLTERGCAVSHIAKRHTGRSLYGN